MAVIKPKTDQKTSPDALRTYFAQFAEAGALLNYGVPDRVEIVETIAKISVGKISTDRG